MYPMNQFSYYRNPTCHVYPYFAGINHWPCQYASSRPLRIQQEYSVLDYIRENGPNIMNPAKKTVNLNGIGLTNLNGLRQIDNAEKIEVLFLNNNLLSIINPDDFKGLNNLKFLFLNENEISIITPGSFNLPNLKQLYLNQNAINQLLPNTFQGATQLIILDLRSNLLTELENDVFYGIENLQRLLFNFNNIKIIKIGAFNSLPRLVALFLNNNQLSTLHRTLFNKLLNLEDLVINNNKFPIRKDQFKKIFFLDRDVNILYDPQYPDPIYG